MTEYLYLLIPLVVGYLIGSVNFSVVVTKYIGKIDIRKCGSGNAGGTNVARAMGVRWGATVIVLEIMKCVLVAMLARFVFPADSMFTIGDVTGDVCGSVAILGCMVGNMLPCYHGFRGGKCVTTGAALALTLDWRLLVALLVVFAVIFIITRTVSICSICGSICLIAGTVLIYAHRDCGYLIIIAAVIVGLSIIIRHKDNIVRIFKGTENKFTFGKKG